jgi:hypothetical protein
VFALQPGHGASRPQHSLLKPPGGLDVVGGPHDPDGGRGTPAHLVAQVAFDRTDEPFVGFGVLGLGLGHLADAGQRPRRRLVPGDQQVPRAIDLRARGGAVGGGGRLLPLPEVQYGIAERLRSLRLPSA